MFKTVILLVLSFFAVIGFVESVIVFLETVSTSKYNQVKSLTVVAELAGEIDNVSFLLNTLLLQSERICYNNVKTNVLIRDSGLSEDTYSEICSFCFENDNIDVEK